LSTTSTRLIAQPRESKVKRCATLRWRLLAHGGRVEIREHALVQHLADPVHVRMLKKTFAFNAVATLAAKTAHWSTLQLDRFSRLPGAC